MKNKSINPVAIYQAENGQIAFRGDFEKDTVWGTLNQIADLFGRDKSVISRHIHTIFESGELEEFTTVAKIATVQTEGARQVTREIEYYNLDMILSVGYRVDSSQATQFRIWATNLLKQHLLDGYTINKTRIAKNYEQFLSAVASVKALLPASADLKTNDVIDLIQAFASTWFSLDAYDVSQLPKEGASKNQVTVTGEELSLALNQLKQELVAKHQASPLFGQERQPDSIHGVLGNIFQSFDNQDVYPSIEEKAANLLYLLVKNHPLVDGNKRSGAFAFVWFLNKAGILRPSLTPEALTALTLLVAESSSKEKDRIIGLIVLLLNGKYEYSETVETRLK